MNAPISSWTESARELGLYQRFRLLSLPQRRLRSFREAVIAGLAGDRNTPLLGQLPQMSWRDDYEDVSADRLLHLANRRRRGTRDVVIFIHGLMIDESCWKGAIDPFCNHVESRFGWTPLYVRYNTGLHISANGALLADRLIELAESWGPQLGGIQLIGHSMGGLVARSCLEVLRQRNHSVLDQVERMFLLCTPNGGVEVEQLRYGVENGLRLMGELAPQLIESFLPQERANSKFRDLAARAVVRSTASAAASIPRAIAGGALWFVSFPSDGIRDVRFGYMQPQEWQLHQRDEFAFMTNHRRPLPPPEHVKTYAVAASLWPTITDVPSRIRNDGIVTVASVAAQTLDFDDLSLQENDHFKELPLLAHQMAPVSPRIADCIDAWVHKH